MALLDGTVLLIIGVLLVLVGIGLAVIGRKLWGPFMSIAGAIIGGSAGYVVGVYYAPQEPLVGLVLALLGSLIGSILFNYLVKIALALIAALIPTVLVYFALGVNPIADQSAQSNAVIVAILVLLIFFSLAYYFVDELIGIVTAIVGAFLFGIGVLLLTFPQDLSTAPPVGLAILGGLGLFAVGSIVQTVAIRKDKKIGAWRARRKKAAAAQTQAPPHSLQPAPPPPPPPPPPKS